MADLKNKSAVNVFGDYWLTAKLKGRDNFLRNLVRLQHKCFSNSWSNTLVDTRH